VESRAAEPIVPLDLFRNRGYAVTILVTFLSAMGFFGAIVYLPLWFQTVREISPTESGLQTLSLLAGLILGSIISGAMVSRTGRYKMLIATSMLIMTVGLWLMTNLTSTTDLPMLWVWMFITGLGIGPSFWVLTRVVQSVVPFERLGVATSNLTFFRQIGGSVGLAVVGTLFASGFADRLGPELVKAGVPPQAAEGLAASGGSDQFTQIGTSVRAGLEANLPAQLQPFLEQILAGIYQAFSLAVANTFWMGVIMSAIALVAVIVALPEVPLRGMERAAAKGKGSPTEGSDERPATPVLAE
jgi:MFS family permease